MNLASASGSPMAKLSFAQYASAVIKSDGFLSLYSGLGAGKKP
jgi:hypothetical protein